MYNINIFIINFVFFQRKKQPALGRLSQQKYDIIKSKLDGGFKVPDKQQTKEQKQALNLLRKRKDFSIDTEGRLRCHEKIIIPAEKLTSEVKRLYEKSHGCGPRTLYNKMKETHTGFSVRNIVTILEKSELFHRQHPRFRNKPIPKTVWSSRPGKRWQIDVVSMANTSVEYKGDKYVYILQIVDVFSRYMMPQPLQSKQSSEIAKVLKTVILEHGAPNEIQCDNGKEFQGKQMRSLMQEFNIRMIHGRPYYPQSQGKCEHSNRLLRRRIEFACTKNQGFNWVEGLSNIAHEINTSVKRILGNVTPFEAYHGRTHAGRPTNILKIRRKMKHVLKKEQAYLKKKSGQPKNYRKGERVLIRYPFTKSRVPYKRHVLQGIVMKRNRNGTRYYIMYKRPMLRDFKQAWVGIENITSVTIEKEKQKKTLS